MLLCRLASSWVALKDELSRRRALVVDDEEDIRELLREVLASYGFEVEVEGTAEAAWRRLQHHELNLLVVDKNLPDRSGLSLIEQVKAAGLDVPSVVMTGFPSVPTIAEAFQQGASDYIGKPFDDINHFGKRLQSIAETRIVKRYFRRIVTDLQNATLSTAADHATIDELASELIDFKESLRNRLSVFVVDPILLRARALAQTLLDWGLSAKLAKAPETAAERLHGAEAPLVAIVSLSVPSFATFIAEARAREPLTEIIAICDKETLTGALAAVAAGATDFVDISAEHSSALHARTARLVELARTQRLHFGLMTALYRRLRAEDAALAEGLIAILPDEQRRYLHQLLEAPAAAAGAASAASASPAASVAAAQGAEKGSAATAASPVAVPTPPPLPQAKAALAEVFAAKERSASPPPLPPAASVEPGAKAPPAVVKATMATTSPLAGASAAAASTPAAAPASGDGSEHRARLADLGTLAAELAHELRQPLAGLKAHTQLVLEQCNDPKQVRERAKRMLVHIERLERLAERTLAYVRREPAPEHEKRCDLNTAAEATYDLAILDLAARVRIEMQLDPGQPVARADRLSVQQILMNLVTNAKAALADKGGRIRISTHKRGDWVEVEVVDDGPGIAPALRDRLFTQFVTTKAEGTGIGLSLSRSLAAADGGALELVDSEHGAHFRLRLPAL